jgi:hypothetical protein
MIYNGTCRGRQFHELFICTTTKIAGQFPGKGGNETLERFAAAHRGGNRGDVAVCNFNSRRNQGLSGSR